MFSVFFKLQPTGYIIPNITDYPIIFWDNNTFLTLSSKISCDYYALRYDYNYGMNGECF